MTTLAVPFSAIPARPVRWLHEGYVPFRHVTLVVGQAGTSKGVCTLDYAARMTRFDAMPGEEKCSYEGPMDVVVILPEDDANESVAGRLEGANAVTDRVHNLTTFPSGTPFTIQQHIPVIPQAMDEIEFEKDPYTGEIDRSKPRIAADGKPHKVGMVILDPLLAMSENDLRTRGQARPIIEQLEHLAKKRDLVLFLTHHTNADGKAASSKAIVETVRHALTLSRPAKAAEGDVVRIMTVSKSNIGKTGLETRYALAGTLDAPSIVWEADLPPTDESRGYDVATEPITEPEQVTQSEPDLEQVGKHAMAFAGIPEDERYRATYLIGDGTPVVIDDYPTAELAMAACEQRAPSPLDWHEVATVPGMKGAALTSGTTGITTYFGVLDRYAKAAAEPTKRYHEQAA